MAFQDFDVISERRRNEQKQKQRKRILIGVVASILLIGAIGAVCAVVLPQKNDGKKGSPPSSSNNNNNNNHVAHSERVVKAMCSAANYKEKCEGPLKEVVQKDSKLSNPKDLLKLYVKFAGDEVDKAFNKTSSFNFGSAEEKGAFEDCKQLFQDAKDDLETSINELTRIELKRISTRTPDLNSWLSAVISYQQTCVDGFPEGQLKNDLQTLFKDSKEFVSNSLAIVSQVGSFLSTFQSLAGGRLLAEKSKSPLDFLDKVDGLPSWISPKDRRILKAADNKPTPNVTVAKDGSGNFKTISEALAAIPEKYNGRYAPLIPLHYSHHLTLPFYYIVVTF